MNKLFFLLLVILGTAMTTELVAGNLKSPKPTQSVKTVTKAVAGIPFASTQFDDEVECEAAVAHGRGARIFIRGAKNIPDLGSKLIAYACGAPHGWLTSPGLMFVDLERISDGAFHWYPNDREAAKKIINMITWIGSRARGQLKGEITSISIVLKPVDVSFTNEGASCVPEVELEATWRIVSDSLRTSGTVDPLAYHAKALFGEVQYAIHERVAYDAGQGILEIQLGKGWDLEKQSNAIRVEWAKISEEMSYTGSIPRDFITIHGLDGTLAVNINEEITKVTCELLNHGDIKLAVETMQKIENLMSNEISFLERCQTITKLPEGYSGGAVLDAVKVLLPHDHEILGQIEKAKAPLSGL